MNELIYLVAYFYETLSLFIWYFFGPMERPSTDQVPNKYRTTTEQMSLQVRLSYAKKILLIQTKNRPVAGSITLQIDADLIIFYYSQIFL